MSDDEIRRERGEDACMLAIKIVFAIILPPIAVLLEDGCGCSVCLNVVLTLLGWIPGMLHAFYVIVKGDQYNEMQREDRQRRRERAMREAGNSPAPGGAQPAAAGAGATTTTTTPAGAKPASTRSSVVQRPSDIVIPVPVEANQQGTQAS